LIRAPVAIPGWVLLVLVSLLSSIQCCLDKIRMR